MSDNLVPVRDQDDGRAHYLHQAVFITTGGVPKESFNDLIEVNLDGFHEVQVDADVATAQNLGNVPTGSRVLEVINLEALSVGAVFDLDLPAYNGDSAVSIVAAGDLTATGSVTSTPVYDPTTQTRPMTITVTAGATPGETAKLLVRIAAKALAWK